MVSRPCAAQTFAPPIAKIDSTQTAATKTGCDFWAQTLCTDLGLLKTYLLPKMRITPQGRNEKTPCTLTSYFKSKIHRLDTSPLTLVIFFLFSREKSHFKPSIHASKRGGRMNRCMKERLLFPRGEPREVVPRRDRGRLSIRVRTDPTEFGRAVGGLLGRSHVDSKSVRNAAEYQLARIPTVQVISKP